LALALTPLALLTSLGRSHLRSTNVCQLPVLRHASAAGALLFVKQSVYGIMITTCMSVRHSQTNNRQTYRHDERAGNAVGHNDSKYRQHPCVMTAVDERRRHQLSTHTNRRISTSNSRQTDDVISGVGRKKLRGGKFSPPLSSFSALPLEVGSLNPAKSLGARCKLLQRVREEPGY